MAIITGSNFSDDDLVGTAGADAINGFDGNDKLTGLGGADVLNGGAGSFDWASYLTSAAAVTVNLTTGKGSGGDAQGDTLFNIEGLEGSAHNDTLTGDAGSNNISGGDGNDTIRGGANLPGSYDFLDGGAGNDAITGLGGRVRGGSGADRLISLDSGNDEWDFAIMDYGDSPAGIFANLTAGVQGGLAGGNNANGFRVSDGWGHVDLVSGFTTLQDSEHTDVIHVDSTYLSAYGNWIEVRLSGGDDNVVFNGVASARVSYRFVDGAVMIDLQAQTATDLDAADNFIGSDTFSGANQARGSLHNDLLLGSTGADRLLGDGGDDRIFGRGGNDILIGDDSNVGNTGNDYLEGGGGADHHDGWEGFDIAGYSNSGSSVTVNLATGAASGGHAQGDTFIRMEGLEGSAHADTLTGYMGSNRLIGGGGNDVLHGGGVASATDWDDIEGNEGNDTITIVGLGQVRGGAGNDRIIGQTSGFPDDRDFAGAMYVEATSGIFANLTATTNGGLAGGNSTTGFLISDGQGGVDTVSGLHFLQDSDHNDTFRIDSTWQNSFGNYIEIQLTRGNDSVIATGVNVAGLDYGRAQGPVRIDFADGTAADVNAADNFIGDDTFSGVNRARGTSHNDEMFGADGSQQIRGRWGDDYIDGRGGDDLLFGDERFNRSQTGNDTLVGGRGSDLVDGGAGFDTAVFAGLNGAGHTLLNVDGTIFALDRMDRSRDTVIEVELFTDGFQFIDYDEIEEAGDGDALAYAASYNDLAVAFRTNAEAAGTHYLNSGFFEGREVSFDANQYLANWADLAGAFGSDTAAATAHFLNSGVDERRLAEDPLDYIASNNDLINAFAGRSLAQTRTAGLQHYQNGGSAEGRRTGIDFDAEQYLENNADVDAAFGGDDDLAAWHFINGGRNEGRMWEDPLEYVASFGDLITAFGSGSEAAIRNSGLNHFRSLGAVEREQRREGIDFDAEQYLANYTDLRAAFADGAGSYDEEAATLHFIRHGFSEGRTDDVLIV